MIIRTAFDCQTCGQNHVVRIGMGHDSRQTHRFPCRQCGEEMVVALNVDHKNISALPEAIENSLLAPERSNALVVNVHANFVIKGLDRYTDASFSHMSQMQAQFEEAEKYNSTVSIPTGHISAEQPRPLRRPDYDDEWQLLKRSWSLHARGRDRLSKKAIVVASKKFYFDDPLNDLPDWVWRFSMFLGATKYEHTLRAMMKDVRQPLNSGAFHAMLAEHNQDAAARGRRYFNVFREYFSAWGEFSQIHFAVAKGMAVQTGHIAATSGFNSVRMFYGNTFEAFASSVDILAFMNNVLEGRNWYNFRTIDAATYLASDKPKRFDAFADRPGFGQLTGERDSHLRNASHHNELHYDSEHGSVSYREGKGNTGNVVIIPYAEYLSRCSALFFQMVTLLRFELLISQTTGLRFPV